MKKQDFVFILFVCLLFLPFFISNQILEFYERFNLDHPFLISFIKFAVLSTLGEIIGLRIKSGQYLKKGFGILPRALVWGFLGIGIKMAFVIFGDGAPRMLSLAGVSFPFENPSEILKQNFFVTFSGLQLLTAFTISVTMNTFFAPVFMTFHKITDAHILNTGGTLAGFFGPMDVGKIMTEMNWKVQWNFVFKRTIPFFWFPAHTLTFLLPAEFRILFAALLGIMLGILLSWASLKSSPV
jgi:hypothetical protein